MASNSWQVRAKYNNAHYERIYLYVALGEKDRIKEAAQASGKSLNEYIVDAVRIQMGVDGCNP